MDKPLVSIIIPYTFDRMAMYSSVMELARRQTYSNVEILCDHRAELTIGMKRNVLCSQAKGELIVNFDSDDWYALDFIENAVRTMEGTEADIVGMNKVIFKDLVNEWAWLYEYKGRQPYVIGSGMMYKRSVWERNKFQDISVGEDTAFIANAGKVVAYDGLDKMWARIHPGNTASHQVLHMCKRIAFER